MRAFDIEHDVKCHCLSASDKYTNPGRAYQHVRAVAFILYGPRRIRRGRKMFNGHSLVRIFTIPELSAPHAVCHSVGPERLPL